MAVPPPQLLKRVSVVVNGPEVFWVQRGHIRKVAARRRFANLAARDNSALFARKDEIAAFTSEEK